MTIETKNMQFIFKLILLFVSTITLYADTIRIMPLGDSITYDTRASDLKKPRSTGKRTGYRSHLWYALMKANYPAQFVGSRIAGQSVTPPFDPHNEGYPGQTSHFIAGKVYRFMEKSKPNIVLLHIGTNDFRTYSTTGAVLGVESILNEIDRYEHDYETQVRVIVALIIDRREHDVFIGAFNSKLFQLVSRRWKAGDRLSLANMYKDAGLTKNDYADRTHPSDAGYKKMAAVWYKTIMTPYKAYSSAPSVKNDKTQGNTGFSASINVTTNDKDDQNDMDISTVSFVGGEDKDKDGDNDKLSVQGEGVWRVKEDGLVTFRPNSSFTADPTPVKYTIKDTKGQISDEATISINYANKSLEDFPNTITNPSNIESDSIHINETSNSIEFIVNIPENGIEF